MSRARLTRLALALAALACLLAPASAGALFANAADGVEGAEMVSADFGRLEQGDDSTRFAVVSADGRFVAIQTRARNLFADDDPDPAGQFRVGGIFRFDTQTRRLTKVADGDLVRESDGALLVRGAINPSISADGRFVAFSSGQRLVAADANDNVDVYLRDMNLAASDPGAYVLVSALDGGAAAATYAPPATPVAGSAPGVESSTAVAISADGNRVVFRTVAVSNLPAGGPADVGVGQLLVRDVAAQTTTLVSAVQQKPSGLMSDEPAGGALGGAISADGSTVAWTARNVPAQTRFLSGEIENPDFTYYLWRRAPFGPDQPTRRITGLSDPDDPVCRQAEEADPELETLFLPGANGPCLGPLVDQEALRSSINAQLPALSADGNTVAYLTGADPRPFVQSGPGLDLYVTDMRPGISRKQGTVELTRDSFSGDLATTLPIGNIAMSSGGRFLAMAAGRTQFPLPALQLVGTTRTVPGPQELYIVDLGARTVERVTRSISGGDADGSVLDGVSISADGNRVGFASFAGNLFLGDANGRSDAFLATRMPEIGPDAGARPAAAGASSVKVDRAPPRVIVRAKSKKGGVVVLTITVPAAGRIEAVASARTGRPPKPRTIASRKTSARGKGTFSVVMRAGARFRPLLEDGGEIEARVRVTFTPRTGGRKLHGSTTVEFAG